MIKYFIFLKREVNFRVLKSGKCHWPSRLQRMWKSSLSAVQKFSCPSAVRDAPPNATLVTEDGTSFDVHRAIVAQHSLIFSKMFAFESHRKLFHLGGMSSSTLRTIVNWMYYVSVNGFQAMPSLKYFQRVLMKTLIQSMHENSFVSSCDSNNWTPD